ncbi:MAG: ergothioneine biosynthesis protein EgtB [Myxococcota bacterium]
MTRNALNPAEVAFSGATSEALAERYRDVRRASETLVAPLETEDYGLQSMPDASPPKWHLAHTTWFFETFLLVPSCEGYQPFNEQFGYLFNSYYNSVGGMHPRPKRGLLSRPTVAEVFRYRQHVDALVIDLLRRGDLSDRELATIEVGLHHEQQHQELLLTDIKHAFAQNSMRPAYIDSRRPVERVVATEMRWAAFEGGMVELGHTGHGFGFDNEFPRHSVHVEPFELASRLTTNGEFIDFIEDGGYERPELWLSDGWSLVQQEGWGAPLYWERRDGRWYAFTLWGMRPVDPAAPVCHVSYYEADAFASWSGARLPRESEWEVASNTAAVEGSFVESGSFHPMPLKKGDARMAQMFGDVWEWTASAYGPYPGFRTLGGALGEYNGKFMCNQMVLRGGSCATPRSHIRASYRNFWHPHTRFQFSGIRLARSPDASGTKAPTEDLRLTDFEPEAGSFMADVLRGLSKPRKSMPTQYLYDELGSQLFDEICELEEYYPTRTELSIMGARVGEMADAIGPDALVIEYGSGSSIKTRLLLESLHEPVAYVPVDISREHLMRSARTLAERFEGLEVLPVCADFTVPFDVPEPSRQPSRRIVYFPGSTIGNFEPEDAVTLLRTMAEEAGPGGGLLIGVDLRKDAAVLEAAYDDSKGVTAAFNLNLLTRANRELGADFDVAKFRHRAPYDREAGRVEMLLVSEAEQEVTIRGRRFRFEAGEEIHTEYSHKYTVEGFAALAAQAGFRSVHAWTDENALFSVHYFELD